MKTNNVKKVWKLMLLCLVTMFFTMPTMGEDVAKKKFVFIKDDDSDFFNGFATFIEGQVRAKGYSADKCEFKLMSMKGKGDNGPSVLKEVLEYKPTVVVINSVYTKEIILPLKEANIPTVIFGNMNYEVNGKYIFLDNKGMPNSSIVGTYATLENVEINSFKAMEMIEPLKGRKIALLIGNDIANVKTLEKAAKQFGTKIKNYGNVKYVEDMQKMIDKVNHDKEVGWVLLYPPFNRKDKKEANREEIFKQLYTSLKKPNITYWQNDVEKGALLAITADSGGMVLQGLDMAYRILEGEKPQNIKPEYPKKSLLLVNNASAIRLGITIPVTIIDGAWRVYTDYNGKYVGQKDQN